MNFKQKTAMFLATGCFVGNIPIAPGTFGTVLGLPLCFLCSKINLPAAVLLSALLILGAVWSAHEAEKILSARDPGAIVIDEIAGIVVTLIGLPFNLYSVTAGFIIFRVLDIAKPYPIGWLERKLPGGVGVVMDDVAAGICSHLILRVAIWAAS